MPIRKSLVDFSDHSFFFSGLDSSIQLHDISAPQVDRLSSSGSEQKVLLVVAPDLEDPSR